MKGVKIGSAPAFIAGCAFGLCLIVTCAGPASDVMVGDGGGTMIGPGNAHADSGGQSGTRIKTKRFVGLDGSSMFIGLYDSQLDVDCYFLPAADGSLRCLPSSNYVASAGGAYSDAKCTVPLALYEYPGCEAPKYAVEAVSGSCPFSPTRRVYGIGPVYTGTWYGPSPASCNQNNALTGVTAYELGTEIAPSQFVQGSTQVDP